MLYQAFGVIRNPFLIIAPTSTSYLGIQGEGLLVIANNLIKLLVVGASLYSFFNFILAGYGFMSAGGEAKAVEKAWAKIWQSLMGLLVVAGSFVLAAIFGWIIFGNATTLLNPVIYGP